MHFLLILAVLQAPPPKDPDAPVPPFEAVIQQNPAPVRDRAGARSKVVHALPFETKVTVLELRDGRARIRAAAIEGWVEAKAIYERVRYEKKLADTGRGYQAGTTEMAGKGYNKKAENEYKTQKNMTEAYRQLDELMTLKEDPVTGAIDPDQAVRAINDLQERLARFEAGQWPEAIR